jgi:hypothetical protein
MPKRSNIEAVLLALFLVNVTFIGTPIFIAGADTTSQPPFFQSVVLRSLYSVQPDGSEHWGREVIFYVGDPNGVDNLLVDGKMSFTILGPDGIVHPLPDELFDQSLVEGEPQTLRIGWSSGFSGYPEFGEYTITVWDSDGLDTTYTTFPTIVEDVPTTVPTIDYPPNFGTIHETIPTIAWETYVPERGDLQRYHVDVFGNGWRWSTWPSFIPPDATSVVFNFDGSSPVAELAPGDYGVTVDVDIFQRVVYQEYRYIESIDFEYLFTEWRGAEAWKGHSFEVTPRLLDVDMNIEPDTLNLASRGKWITGYIELPEGYDVDSIDTSSILLNNTVMIDADAPTAIGDVDRDGTLDMMVKFDRSQVTVYILNNVDIEDKSTAVTFSITGRLNDGTAFQGIATIKALYCGRGRFLRNPLIFA